MANLGKIGLQRSRSGSRRALHGAGQRPRLLRCDLTALLALDGGVPADTPEIVFATPPYGTKKYHSLGMRKNHSDAA